MTTVIGIGLVGYGGIGRMHALCYRMLPLVYPDLGIRVRLMGGRYCQRCIGGAGTVRTWRCADNHEPR
jgi:hypothetical protein